MCDRDSPIINFYIQQLINEDFGIKIFSLNSRHMFPNAIDITDAELIKLQEGKSTILHYVVTPALFITGKSNSYITQILSNITQRMQQYAYCAMC